MTEPQNPIGKMALPINPERANEVIANMNRSVADGSEREAVNKFIRATTPGKRTAGSTEGVTVESERAEKNKRESLNIRTAASVGIAIDKKREPLQSLINKGIPHEIEKFEDREKVRQWSRKFYKSHNLMSTAIDIYTQFPIQGIEITSKDPELKKFYESLFFDQLDYQGDFLEDFGREYWTVGEVNSLGNWNETLGIWDREQILNPDDIIVSPGSAFAIEPQLYLKIPETIQRIIQTGYPVWEYNMLREEYPEIFEAGSGGGLNLGFGQDSQIEGIDARQLLTVSPHVLSRVLNKVSPWDSYGTPHMMRAFGSLIMEESLNAAQDAVADRLYSPMILAKLGVPAGDLGDGQGAWIPTNDQLAEFTGMMQSAFAADFRFLAYHYGIEIKSVFGKESLPNFDRDYDRLERKMLQVWGIGEGLISGSNAGSYASSALNREFVTQLMSGFQKKIKAHFKKRCEIVAETQEHWDYDSANGVRTVITEEILDRDPDTGQEYIRTRPKLLLPELNFKTMNLRDEAQERSFLQLLKNNGVPIADSSFMVNIDLEFKDELEKIKEEKIQKVVAEQEMKSDLYKTLLARGLPVPDALAQEMEKMQAGGEQEPGMEDGEDSDLPGEQGRPDDGLPGTQGRPEELPGVAGRPQKGSPDNVSGLPMPGEVGRPGQDFGYQGRPSKPGGGSQGRPVSKGNKAGRPKAAGLNGLTGFIQSGIEFTTDEEDAEETPEASENALPDITDPTPTPNLAPDDDNTQPKQKAPKGGSGGGGTLPRNEISQRPEVSDEQRSSAPKSAYRSMRNGPSTLGSRKNLSEESMQEAVDNRKWSRSANGGWNLNKGTV